VAWKLKFSSFACTRKNKWKARIICTCKTSNQKTFYGGTQGSLVLVDSISFGKNLLSNKCDQDFCG